MSGWIARLQALATAGTPHVLVTLAGVLGSTPRAAGTHMIVTAGDSFETIGGGHLEFRAIEIARGMLAGEGGPAARHEDFALGPDLDQCCGGRTMFHFERLSADAAPWRDGLAALMADGGEGVLVTDTGAPDAKRMLVTAFAVIGGIGRGSRQRAALHKARAMLRDRAPAAEREADGVLFEPVAPEGFDIVLFGAGHVGRAVVRVLAGLPCRIHWIDSRADQFPAAPPENATVTVTDAPERAADAAPGGAWYLVMTHSHALDLRLVECIFRRGDFSYLGLIGSATKRARFEKRLVEHGIAPHALARLTCPIGIAGVDGKHPGEIAVAVAAEILALRHAGASRSLARSA